MNFVIQVNAAPLSHPAAVDAYRFCQAVLAAGHAISRVFFYQDGIYHALRYSQPSDGAPALSAMWSALAAAHGIDLVVCIASAHRRGLLHADEAQRQGKVDNDLADGFRIAGLGQWLEASLHADRSVVFG